MCACSSCSRVGRVRADAPAPACARTGPRTLAGRSSGWSTGSFRDNDRGLDYVQQLADVAGPVVAPEHGERRVADALADVEALAQQHREVAGEQIDVRSPSAKRRQRQHDRAWSVVQILPEQSLADHGRQVTVGGGDHADVHVDLVRPADMTKGRRVEHPRQLDLRRDADLADLVEKDRSAVNPDRLHERPSRRALGFIALFGSVTREIPRVQKDFTRRFVIGCSTGEPGG